MGMIPVLFPNAAERGRATTVWITAVTLGTPLGPIVGGLLLKAFWWGSVFLIDIPTVVIAAVAVGLLVPESRSRVRRPIDPLSVVLSAAGLVGLTYGFIRFGEKGWGDGPAWITAVAGVTLLVGLVAWQRKLTHPLVDIGLFRDRGFGWARCSSCSVPSPCSGCSSAFRSIFRRFSVSTRSVAVCGCCR
ncbi:MFS transporter [Nocardia sp. 2YAB30]|uniref:MFS transporter n=1 Tax=unclassified Nocardia TaxID=2637762 RepID=UPI003F955ABE